MRRSSLISKMHRYLISKEKTYHSVTVGCKNKTFVHPALLIPRAQAVNKDGDVVKHDRGFPIQYELKGDAVYEEVVTKWTGSQMAMADLTSAENFAVNKIKFFLNNPEWKCLVTFHDKNAICTDTVYGDHIHIVIESDIATMSRNNEYRTLYRNVTAAGGYVTSAKIHGCVHRYLMYLAEDTEKYFLGTNSGKMLGLFNDCSTDQQTLAKWSIHPEEEDRPQKRAWDTLEWKASTSKEPEAKKVATEPAPSHLNNVKPGETIQYIYKQLRLNPGCTSINSLLCRYKEGSPEWYTMCTIGTSQASLKAFNIALGMAERDAESKAPVEVLKDLPDDIKGYMSPYHSLAMMNKWLQYQKIKPLYFMHVIRMLLEGEGRKRIGVYLHGSGNSGKTMISNSSWDCCAVMVGKMTSDSIRFMCQCCGGKKIFIGEEIAITSPTIDIFKNMMSGAEVLCQRKNLVPDIATPNLVFMNSNVKYTHAIDSEQAAVIALRLYNFENLKKAHFLSECYGKLHPKMYLLPEKPTAAQYRDIKAGNDQSYTDEAVIVAGQDAAVIYDGNWEDIPIGFTGPEALSPLPHAWQSPLEQEPTNYDSSEDKERFSREVLRDLEIDFDSEPEPEPAPPRRAKKSSPQVYSQDLCFGPVQASPGKRLPPKKRKYRDIPERNFIDPGLTLDARFNKYMKNKKKRLSAECAMGSEIYDATRPLHSQSLFTPDEESRDNVINEMISHFTEAENEENKENSDFQGLMLTGGDNFPVELLSGDFTENPAEIQEPEAEIHHGDPWEFFYE